MSKLLLAGPGNLDQIRRKWGKESSTGLCHSSLCNLAQGYTLCLDFPFPKKRAAAQPALTSSYLSEHGDEFLHFYGCYSPGSSVPTKDVDTLILENFKNRKEVYLFSRMHNWRPAEGREWYFAEVLFTGWTQRKSVIRWKCTARSLRRYLLRDIGAGLLWWLPLCQAFCSFHTCKFPKLEI